MNALETRVDGDRAEWLAARRKGIGGSDAAAVVGLDRYRTPLSVYLEKRGEIVPDDLSDNDAVRFGNLLEDVIADEYARRTGRTVHRVNRILQSDQHPYMLANLDRRVVGERRGLEIKTANVFAAKAEDWGEPGTDVVPTRYLLQVQHYMAVTGYDVFDLAVLIGGQDFRIHTIARDEALIANLISIESDFWARVQDGRPPAIISYEEAARVFPQHTETPILATPEIAAACARYRELKATEKDVTGELKDLQGKLAAFLGAHDTLVVAGSPALTWRTQDATRFDSSALKADHPDLFDAYSRTATSRVMRLKGK